MEVHQGIFEKIFNPIGSGKNGAHLPVRCMCAEMSCPGQIRFRREEKNENNKRRAGHCTPLSCLFFSGLGEFPIRPNQAVIRLYRVVSWLASPRSADASNRGGGKLNLEHTIPLRFHKHLSGRYNRCPWSISPTLRPPARAGCWPESAGRRLRTVFGSS